MNDKGTVLINDEYMGIITDIIGGDTKGKYIENPPQYPQFIWEKLFVEVYNTPSDIEIEKIEVRDLDVGFMVEYDTELDIIDSYYDYNAGCVIIEAR